jgi:formylglycine-generating enzyme required for sulfatase activity
MRRWFLSYHSPDRPLAERVKAAIERKDLESHVFFAPADLRAGGLWSAQLAQEIADATAFILLVGERGLGDWQVLEYDEALDKRVKSPDFPVILMLLERQTAPGLPFLRRVHWIVSRDPASEKDVARLLDAASGHNTRPGELWRHTSPYRGLAAMEEKDSDFFFGRERETIEVVSALAAFPGRIPILLGNSGVGKSSLAQAGVLAALKRQAWPEEADARVEWPHAFRDSRRWCFLTLRPGADPLKSLVGAFLQMWQFDPTDPRRETRRTEWIESLRDGGTTLTGLLDATEGRLQERGQPKPPSFFLYIDQGEELYVRSQERSRRRFSEVLVQALGDQRFAAMMSLRADFLGALQNDAPLFNARRQIDVPPLREAQLCEVVSRPAALLSARFEVEALAVDIARRAAEESARDAGALPLLSYLLDDMWIQMINRGDGTLRLPAAAIEPGGVLAERANAFLARHPKSEDALRRLLTLKLATVHEDGEPTRRRAPRSEFNDDEWRLVSELADHPNRLLVTATPERGETYAEVAHEAILRRWQKLQEWLAGESEFLAWRSGLEAARRSWRDAPEGAKNDALLMGFPLVQAQGWLAQRGEDLSRADREFLELSIRRDAVERAQQEGLRRRARQMGALVGVLLLGIGTGLAWSNRAYLRAVAVTWAEVVWPKVLTAEAEHALQPGQSFKECVDCPAMVVVPAGEFMMGSPKEEKGHGSDEEPQHKVSIRQRFAVSRSEVTFEEWDACVTLGGCNYRPSDQGWGRGTRPVINVSWHDARQFVAWLSKRTGKSYRLLSEAEWEEAARAGGDKSYSWGDELGKNNANCEGCGSPWDLKQTAPVGSFAANKFGLDDMQGNVWQWVEDCWHSNYQGAPNDGSAWTKGANCNDRVVRGGSWDGSPGDLRAANRLNSSSGNRSSRLGFRVGRTLIP